MFADLSTTRENTDGYTEKYICATALYLLSILVHVYDTQ